MKHFKSLLPIVAGAVLAASFAPAARAAETVIVTVNVAKVLESYYKVEDFLAELKEQETQINQKVTAMGEEGKALIAEFEELREQASSDILTEGARQDASTDAQKKLEEIQQKENEYRQFIGEMQRRVQAARQQQMSVFYGEISELVREIASERGATLVIDVSARAADGRFPILAADDSYDITPQVIEQANSTEGEEKAADAAAPAAE